ncbi:unnamed protein product, partial [Durusdinium trenchii]
VAQWLAPEREGETLWILEKFPEHVFRADLLRRMSQGAGDTTSMSPRRKCSEVLERRIRVFPFRTNSRPRMGGGGACYEVDPDSVVKEERMVYAGEGRGSYQQVSSMEFAGKGSSRPDLKKQQVLAACV